MEKVREGGKINNMEGNRIRMLFNFDRTITFFKDNEFVAIVSSNFRGDAFPTGVISRFE